MHFMLGCGVPKMALCGHFPQTSFQPTILSPTPQPHPIDAIVMRCGKVGPAGLLVLVVVVVMNACGRWHCNGTVVVALCARQHQYWG